MILVDNANISYNGKIWHHMTSDASLDELHEFAEKLGLKREWFQDKDKYLHYDIVNSKFELAISLGARPVDVRTAAHYSRKLYEDNKNNK